MVASSSSNRPRSWTSKLVLTAGLFASTTQLAAAQSYSSSTAQVSGSTNTSSSAPANSSSSASTSTSTSTNPLIPNSISPRCHSFLASLNGDSHISSCTAPLLTALESFQPSSSLDSYTPSSSSAVAETLASFCAAPSCDDSKIRSLLNQFNGNCSTELQAGNDVVLGSYDSLYILTPLKQSICEQDGAGGYCLIDIAKGDVPSSSSSTAIASSNSSSQTSSESPIASPSPSALAVNSTGSDKFVMLAASTPSSIEAPAPPSLYIQITNVAKRLMRRQQAAAESWSSSSSYMASASAQASPSASASGNSSSSSNSTTASSSTTFKLPSLLPNSQTYRSMSLPFLFLSSSLPSTTLCTPCTKQILTNYISFESRQPYALGLANSPILGGQGELWQGTGEKCGAGFLTNIMQMSGQQELTGAASSLTSGGGITLGAVAVAGVVSWFTLMV
ncbi:uncharacterized protein JCM6883_000986 [Sporobolomyces salmoneus]|uniref:uncharacterized protein n=1 Tax=Sporobolomyces salmoneus TaxID=183962 RepID=UPI00317E5B9B